MAENGILKFDLYENENENENENKAAEQIGVVAKQVAVGHPCGSSIDRFSGEEACSIDL